MSTKSRSKIVPTSAWYRSVDGSTTSYNSSVQLGWQQIVSRSNPHWLLGKVDSDIGGPFTSFKSEWSALPEEVHLQGDFAPSLNGFQSRGVLVPSFVRDLTKPGMWASESGITGALNSPVDSQSQMEVMGTTAIARSLPTSPAFDGATAVAELYSGIPGMPAGAFVNHIPKEAFRGNVIDEAAKKVTLKGVADDYLNYQFAVAPTISDERSLRQAAQESEKIIAQLERDSGKTVRRSYVFPPVTQTVENELSWPGAPCMLAGSSPTAFEIISAGAPPVIQRSTYTTERKFSGAFTYHLPPKGTWRRKIAQLDAVYGIRPGVDTAWNAVPFSWMADWYGNMGDVLTNLQAFGLDGNVLKYGYISSRTTRIIRYSGQFTVRKYGDYNNWSQYPFTVELKFTALQRYPANPFGFGPTGGALTPRRIAILAALGLGQV